MTRKKRTPITDAIDFIRGRATETESARTARKRAIAEAESKRKDQLLEDECARLRELEQLRRDPEVMAEQQRDLRRALTLPGRESRWSEPGYEMRIFEQVVWRVN